MNKADLVNAVAEKTSLQKNIAAQTLEAVFDAIKQTLGEGHTVSFPDFGVFKINDRKAREGRNPKTGETIKIAAKKVVAFKPSKQLKEIIQK